MAMSDTMPWSDEAEKSVLSAILADPERASTAIEILTGEEFVSRDNRLTYQAVKELYAASKAIDAITLAEQLKTMGVLEAIGSYAFLGKIIDYAPGRNLKEYANTVKDKHLTRKLIIAAADIQAAAIEDGGGDIASLLEGAEKRIFDVAESSRIEGAQNIEAVLWPLFEEFERRQSGDYMPGIPTGYDRIDKMTSGLRNGQLVIIAGRPSMGKTAMALNIAANAAITHARGVAVFSLEMSKEELGERLISAEARVDSQRLRTGSFHGDDYAKMAVAAGHLKSAKIIVDDTPGLRPLEFRAKARRIKAEHDIDLIVVDYLQLMSGDTKTNNRVQEISEISRSLKTTARELNVPIIALSQLSREVERRHPPRPILSDLRDSGSIEQDADIVIFIYRPEFYFGEMHDGKDIKGQAEVIIGKQRNGPTGMVRLKWNAPITRFE
jgi:replicative DNA helicase